MADSMQCSNARPLLEALVDGELGTEQTLLLEQHLDHCRKCTQFVEFACALKNSVSRVVSSDVEVSDGFRNRLQSAIQAEYARENKRDLDMLPPTLRPMRHSVTATIFALAAGALIWIGVNNRNRPQPLAEQAAGTSPTHTLDAAMGVEQTLDRLIDHHLAPPRPQVTNVDLLPSFDTDVGVHIRLPQFTHFNAQWEGANLVPVKNRNAASLRYRMLGHRVTVYVYDASKMHIADRLERRIVKDNPVYVGQWRGYNVASTENRGTGYAATADLDSSELEQIVSELR